MNRELVEFLRGQLVLDEDRVTLKGEPGARFTAAAAGATPVLFLADDQGTYRLKKRWGRPAF